MAGDIAAPDAALPELEGKSVEQKLDALTRTRPMIDASEAVGFSVGYVHGRVTDAARLRNFISGADEKMYEIKKQKKRARRSEKI